MHFKASLAVLVLIFSTLIISHQRSESYSRIDITNDKNLIVEIDFNVQISVLSRIKSNFDQSWESKLQEEILNNYKVQGSCELDQGPYLRSSLATGYVSLRWRQVCDKESAEILFNLFFSEDSTHVHIATINIDEQPYPEKIFTVSSKSWTQSSAFNKEKSSAYSSFYDYLELGVKHILTGLDHIAFLLGLLLLNLKARTLIIVITGFTVGHSITLALGALNYITPASSFVEALIGYSIVIVAIECVASITKQYALYNRYILYSWILFILFFSLFGSQKYIFGLLGLGLFSYCYFGLSESFKNQKLILIVTMLFGLVHGFGFAGNLSSIGLMQERFIPALIGFNLGVEVGQILIILSFLALIYLLKRLINFRVELLRIYTASGLASLGIFWFVERLF
tara:strand:- start:1047 stop:2237 length:1191 start_codon:yes stop_codon:yes gene_type:complete